MNHRREPTLSELLDDPIVIAMMTRDGFTREHILRLVERVRRNRQAAEPAPLAA